MWLATAATYLLALLAAGLLAQASLSWAGQQIDSLRYGFPRSGHLSGYVGHGDERTMPTHIITLNLSGQIKVLVLPGGDADAMQVLTGPYLVGRDAPYETAMPALQDLDGDGHVDLLVTVRGESIVYVNKDGRFRLITPEERTELLGESTGL
jgi:hypothetical protein